MIADLSGKVALVTGAASGIGRAVVDCFVGQGATVVATDIDAALLDDLAARRRAGTVHPSVVDVTSRSDLDRAVAEAVELAGRLDVLVCSAGVVLAEDHDRAADADADWDRCWAVNVRGVVNSCEAALPALRASGAGAIVTVGSMSAHAARTTAGAYPASKAAALRYTKSLALTQAPTVRVNAVCPGAVWSGIQARILGEVRKHTSDALPDDDLEAFAARYGDLFPLQRPQSAEHVAKAIAFLASDDAGSTTGQCLHVDGGAIIRD